MLTGYLPLPSRPFPIFSGSRVFGLPNSLKSHTSRDHSAVVRLVPGQKKIEISSLSDEQSEILSSLSTDNHGPLQISYDLLRDLPHELVCFSLFGARSGVNISDLPIWETIPLRKMTPDWYQRCGSTDVIFEVKTCRANPRSRVDEAVAQYSEALTMTREESMCFYLVATPDEVILPLGFPLEPGQVNHISSLVKLGQNIQDQCEGLGLPRNLLGYYPYDRVKIPNVPLLSHHDDKLIITQEMVNAWDQLNNRSNQLLDSLEHNMLKNLRKDQVRSPIPKYHDGDSGNHLLRQGLFLVSHSQAPRDLKLDLCSNSILRELLTLYNPSRPSKKPKHLYLRGRLGDWMLRQQVDYLHGLWGDTFSEDESLFRHKENLSLPKEMSREVLATLGITQHQMETFRTEKIKKRQRSQNKRCLFIDSDITNLSQLITSKVPENHLIGPEVWKTVDGRDLQLPYREERWFSHASFWQRLVEEINIGRYSARGKWNRFHVQKIEPYNAWIYVHGTGPDSHQFYYCVAHMLVPPTFIGDWEDLNDGWWCTSVIQSLRTDKLSQHLNILETLTVLRKYWDSALEDVRAREHFTVSFLSAFDAKQATIDTLSLFRYIYMELCKEVGNRDPAKVLTKLPVRLHTNFQGWVVSRMCKLCEGSYGEISEDDLGQVSFRSLVSWVDWQPVPNFRVILSLSYMHYSTPHPISIGLHGKVRITGKLLKEELKLSNDCSRIGWTSPDVEEIGPHEFSVSAVKDMAAYSSRRLKSVYPSFRSLMDEYASLLKSWNFAEFATFKKSTRIDDPDPARRGFCFEELQRLMTRIGVSGDQPDESPYEYLARLVEDQKSNPRNRNVSIFVKDQQTGLREIFVLPMTLRILVKSMEIFSRLVNKTLPNETLSEPSRKHSLVMKHSELAKQSRSMLISSLSKESSPSNWKVLMLRYSSSSDAKTWCQQFCMPTFGCYIRTLLHDSYGSESDALSNFFLFILNEMTQKHIHIDSRVKRWFNDNKTTPAFDESFQLLKTVMLGTTDLLASDGGIINRSNMMQGIPHETSSSLHASYLLMCSTWLKKIVSGFANTKWTSDLKIGEAVVTTMVSSDDSGLLFSLPVAYQLNPEGTDISDGCGLQLTYLRKMLTSIGLAVEESKPLFGALVSYEKSTIFAETPVFEFNSRFYVGTSINTAEIKFMTSQLTLGFHSDIRDRISEALSSLSVVLSQGLDQDLLDIIQLCLNRIHLRFLYGPGLTPEDKSRLNKLNLPALGWLPLMPKGFIGLFNSKLIGDYLFESNHSSSSKYSQYINRPGWELENSFSLYLKLNTLYNKVCKQFKVSRESILHDILSTSATASDFLLGNLPELIKIRMKILNPGARSSMSRVDLCKIHMASCYAAMFPCITIRTGERSKHTLLECLTIVEGTKTVSEYSGRNPQIQRLIQMSNDGTIVSKNSWPRKGPYNFQITPSGCELGIGAREALIRGWTKGFSHRLSEYLSWARSIDGRIHEDLARTITSFEGDLLLLDASLRSLDDKVKNINLLIPQPQQNTLTSVYSSLLRHSWSGSESKVIGMSTSMLPEPIDSSTDLVATHSQQVISSASRVAWGFRSLRRSFMSQYLNQRDMWESPLPEHRIRNFSDALAICSGKCPECLVDLRRLLRVRKGPIYNDKNSFYQCISGYWYKGIRGSNCTDSIVYREPGTPMLLERDWCQLEAQGKLFQVSNKDLYVVLCSAEKELQIRFRTQKSYEVGGSSCLMSMPLPGIDHVSYAANCQVRGLNRDFLEELLSKVMWGGRELQDWSFWQELDELTRSSNYTDVEKSLVRDVLQHAQSQTASNIQSSVTYEENMAAISEILPDPQLLEDVPPRMVVTEADLSNFYAEMVALMEEDRHAGLNRGEDPDQIRMDEDMTEDLTVPQPVGGYECMEIDYGNLMNITELYGDSKPRKIMSAASSTRFWTNLRSSFSRAVFKRTSFSSKLFSKLRNRGSATEVLTSLYDGTIMHLSDPRTELAPALTLETIGKGWHCESNFYNWVFLAYEKGWVTREKLMEGLGWKGIYRDSNPHELGSEEFWSIAKTMRGRIGVELNEYTGMSWAFVDDIERLKLEHWDDMDDVEKELASAFDDRILHDLTRLQSPEDQVL